MSEAARLPVYLPLPLAADFIERCAQDIIHACRPLLPDLSQVLIVVPNPELAPALRCALAAAAGQALRLPGMGTLAQLAGAVGGQPDSQRQLLLYRQLREQGWFAEATVWEVAAELLALFDELNELNIGLPDGEEEFLARLESAYALRDSSLLRFEAEVVHRLWRAEAAGPPGRQAAMAQALARRAAQATAPLFLLGEGRLRPLEQSFCEAWACHQPVQVFEPRRDLAEAPSMQTLNLAWPTDPLVAPVLALRADEARQSGPQSALAGRLRLIGAASLEEEAATVVATVKRWLAAGAQSIALVAADRVPARRARALLERDAILVQDETGWTLSTTRAAALVDAWLEVIAADAYHRDLLDLVKSPFIFSDLPEAMRQSGLLQLEAGLARHNLSQGLERIESILARETGFADALGLLARIRAAQRRMPRGSALAADWLARLEQALEALGAHAALAQDEAGATLLGLLCTRREELGAVLPRLTFAEWREWLNRELEAATFVERSIESPIVMTHLAATRLRRFEAALLIGADREHLAAQPMRAIFGHPGVRADLGLPLPAQAQARLRDDLAGLIEGCREVVATWQVQRDGEANLPCAELSVLSALHRRAWGDDLIERPRFALVRGLGAGTPMPRPSVAQRLPERISPSAYASLVACPYQFYARYLLGLKETQEVREELEKRDYGECVHRILQRFHDRFPSVQAQPEGILNDALEAISREAFAPQIEASFLGHAWLARWLQRLPGYIAWQKAREAGGWRHAASERQLERSLSLEDGSPLVLAGRIDRLDRNTQDGEAILDYKTQGAQSLRERMHSPGEEVQLASYAWLQGDRVEAAAYVSLDGAKPADVALDAVPRAAQAQGVRLAAAFSALRGGAGLPAHGADAVCQWCEMRGLCRRDYHISPACLSVDAGDSLAPPAGDGDA